MKSSKQFEIFSGTGGVGKTTLATSRAISLAKSGKSVLLITIDPAKRLREILNLGLDSAGQVTHLPDPFNKNEKLDLYVELMNPEYTFKRIAKESNSEEILDNRILKILTSPFGGLNEILSIVELNIQYKSKKFDVIVLDTPPGSHFLDFLDSVDRIKVFFDQSFIDIFNYLGKKTSNIELSKSKKIFNLVVSTGVKKLLGYLNKVTGDKFIDDFIDAILSFYKTKDSFLDALNLQNKLKQSSFSNWFLVTSVEQNKLKEALELKAHAKDLITKDSVILLNKCIENSLNNWEATGEKEIELKDSLILREQKLKEGLKKYFDEIIEFPEVFQVSPEEHIKNLTTNWNNT